MAHYVDGLVIPIPKKNLNTYPRLAQKAAWVWKDLGMMKGPRMLKMMKSAPMSFGGKRMMYGGFKSII